MDPLARQFDRFRRDGDLQALGAVFDALAPRLLPVALHLAGNPADAEDALQQTFLLAMRRADAFDASRRLEPWLAGLLTNTIRNARRHDARHRACELPELASGDAGPLAAAERSELVAKLRTHVADLPGEQRQVLMLQLQHGLLPAEIAEVLEVPPGTVRMRIHRGLASLRNLLPAGLAAWLCGSVSARGLAAVRQTVMQMGREHAAAAATTAASVVEGALLMKKVVVGLMALLLVGLLWQLAPVSSAAPTAALPSAPGANATAAALARPPGAAQVLAPVSDRVAVEQPIGSLRIRVVAAVPGDGFTPGSSLPLGGALLQVWPGDVALLPFDAPSQSLMADALGEVLLPALAAGRWQVLLASDGDAEPLATEVEPGAETLLRIERTAARVVRGIVVDADGVPVADAELWVDRDHGIGRYGLPTPPECRARRLGCSGIDGRFAVAVVQRENRIDASKPGFGQSLGRDVGDAAGELRVVLSRQFASLSGTVRDGEGHGVANAVVLLSPPGRDRRRAADGSVSTARVERLTRTDAQGRFGFEGLAPGQQRVVASAWPYLHGWLDVGLEAFSHVEIDVTLGDSVAVVGTVRYADGSPALAGVESGPNAEWRDGHFMQCDVRADGSYVLLHQPRKHFFVRVGTAAGLAAVREFTAPEGSLIRCDFVLEKLTRLRGRVLGPDGQPLPHWWVLANSGRGVASAGTNALGEFVLGVAMGEQLTVAVHAPDGQSTDPALEREHVVAGEPLELLVPATALPQATVRGRLVRSDGVGIAGRRLAIDTVDDRRFESIWSRHETDTQTDGTFALGPFAAGHFALALPAGERFGETLQQFELTCGQHLDLGAIVVPVPATLAVTMQRADGSAWRGAMPWIDLRTEAGAQVQFDATAGAGGRTLAVAAGRYVASVRGPDLIAGQQEVELAAGETTTIAFRIGIGRSRELVCNGDGHDKPERNAPLHLVVRQGDTEILRRDLPADGWSLMGFRYWSLDHVFAFGRYEFDGATDAGLHYRAAFEVREDLEDPTRVDVPLVGAR